MRAVNAAASSFTPRWHGTGCAVAHGACENSQGNLAGEAPTFPATESLCVPEHQCVSRGISDRVRAP